MKALALALACMLAPAVAHADGPIMGPVQCQFVECTAGPHAGQSFPCSDPNCGCECLCTDSCSGTPRGNPAAAMALAKLIAYVFSPVVFVIVPGHFAEWLGAPIGNSEVSHRNFRQYVAERKQVQIVGRKAERERAQIARAEHEQRAEAAKPQPWKMEIKVNPPHLVPAPNYACDQARWLMPSTPTTGPIGPFPTFAQMMTACASFILPPEDQDKTCGPDSYHCGTDPIVCCPHDAPVLNFCDKQCYRDTDFRGAKDDAGRFCQESRDCATTLSR